MSTFKRGLFVVPVMLGALWLTATVTTSAAMSRVSPILAFRLDASNSGALEQAATAAAAEATVEGGRRAVELATRALIVSPMSSEAASALAAGRSLVRPQENVLPMFKYSRFLMRRNMATEIWFIEHGADSGNIDEALRAYDHVFRVSNYYRQQFMPVLVSASIHPEIAGGVAGLLANRPAWRFEYYSALLNHPPGPAEFFKILEAMRFDTHDSRESLLLSAGLSRLVEMGRPDIAYGIYRRAVGGGDTTVPRDRDFRRPGILPPFDWELTDTGDLLASVGTNQSGQSVLELSNRGGSGTLARQVLMLSGGSYRLSYLVGDVTGAVIDRPRMQITCLSNGGALLTSVLPTVPSQGQKVAATFTVPPQGCRTQWLMIQAGAPVDAVDTTPWIRDIRIVLVGSR